MTVSFQPAKRAGVSLLIGIAGPSGSGKTYSALLLAKGLSAGKPFAFIDTESGRGLHYADEFDFLHAELEPPFSPARYSEALHAAADLQPPVIVVDSATHEHAGTGGVLDMHEAELHRLAGDDWKKRESMKFAAWIKPKAEHKRLVSQLLQIRSHVILCLRAEEKIDLVKDPKTGKLEVKPKRTLAGHVGWIPVCGKELPYELTLSLVVTPDAPGVPQPIKLQEQHRQFVALDKPLSEDTGRLLGEWASGSVGPGSGGAVFQPQNAEDARASGAVPPTSDSLLIAPDSAIAAFLELAARAAPEVRTRAEGGLRAHRDSHGGRVDANWLERQTEKLTGFVPVEEEKAESLFAGMVPGSAREPS